MDEGIEVIDFNHRVYHFDYTTGNEGHPPK